MPAGPTSRSPAPRTGASSSGPPACKNEAYRCVGWDGSRHVGERLFVKVVDRATGGWGHINLDGVDTVNGTCARGATPHYAADPYRPQFHFSARRGWINDPNGMVHWRGQYHLFYQHNPRAPVFGPMHWGHAVSDDLVRWRHLPIALAPKPTDIPGDLSGVFSGNAVDHDGALNLFYTDFTDKTKHPEATAETVALATSRDGRRFDADPSRPLIPAAPESAGAGWRDPYVVKEPDGSYLMVVGAGDERTGRGNVQLLPLARPARLGVPRRALRGRRQQRQDVGVPEPVPARRQVGAARVGQRLRAPEGHLLRRDDGRRSLPAGDLGRPRPRL